MLTVDRCDGVHLLVPFGARIPAVCEFERDSDDVRDNEGLSNRRVWYASIAGVGGLTREDPSLGGIFVVVPQQRRVDKTRGREL